MKNFIKKIKSLGEFIVFDENRKADIRSRLTAHMRGVRAMKRSEPGWMFSTIFKKRYVLVSIFAIILMIIGGGTSSAAEGSLPGDFLYPVKVKINEPIATALTFSQKNKAELQAKLAEKRLMEAEKLAAKGGLSEEREKELERAFESSKRKLEDRLQSIESSGEKDLAENIGLKFDDVLREYLSERKGEVSSTEALKNISKVVNEAVKNSKRSRKDEIEKRREEKESLQEKIEKRMEKEVEKKLRENPDDAFWSSENSSFESIHVEVRDEFGDDGGKGREGEEDRGFGRD